MTSRQKELADIKQNLSFAIQGQSQHQQNHFTNLLENQSKELVRMKRLIEEYDKREKQCTRKWNALLQENLGF